MPQVWDDIVDKATCERYERAGYGRPAGFGSRPAILLVDLFTTEIAPEFPDPLPADLESALAAIRALIGAGRRHRVPFFFSNDRFEPDGSDLGCWRLKSRAAETVARRLAGRPCPWLPGVAPEPGDRVVYKQRPSVFFGTLLLANLLDLGIDTLVVGGQTTSGCVRATVVDGFSYGFRTSVVEECTYDRCVPSHKINLFDIHQKYADVIPLADVISRFGQIACSGAVEP